MKKISLLLILSLAATLAVKAQKLPGTADSSFNGNGFSLIPAQEKSSTLVTGYLDTAGKPILIGGSQNLQFKWSIGSTRINTDGKLDLSYKNNGYGLIDFDPESNESEYDAFVTSDGGVLHAAAYHGPNGLDMMIYKTSINGTFDLNYGLSGFWKQEIDPGYERPIKIIEDQNGFTLVLGEIPFGPKTIYLARFFPYGGLDSSFGVDGKVLLKPLNESNNAVALIERPQGGYYIICNTDPSGNGKVTVMSISKNGNYNIDLGGPGEIQFQYNKLSTRATSVKYLNGSLIIAGEYDSPQGNTDGFITRLEMDGTINTTFNQTGFNFIRRSFDNPADEEVRDMIISEDSSIFVISVSTLDSNLLIISRFQSDGNVYGQFGNIGGHHHTYLPGSGLANSGIGKLLLDEEKERLYLLGHPSQFNQGVFAYAVYTGKFAEKGGPSSIKGASKLALRLYPNPANQSVRLDLPIEELTVEVFSLQGQRIAQYKNINQFDVSVYTNGTYFVVAHSAGAVYSSRLQIINH